MSWSGLAGAIKQTSKKIVNLSLAGIISISGLAVATPFLFAQNAAALNPVAITELMADPSAVSDTNGEWIEVQNTTGVALSLNGYKINGNSVSGTAVVANGQSGVICRNGDESTNGGVNCDYTASFSLSNSGGSLALSDSANNPVDSVVYAAPTAGHSQVLVNGTWQVETTNRFGAGDYGTPFSDKVVDTTRNWSFPTINQAIQASLPSDTINVAPGTYTENVVVNKAITLNGASAGSTTIVATDANSSPLTFATSGAIVKGFTITHNYTPTELSAWNFNNNGVTFNQLTSGNTLENSTVSLNRNGIYLNRSSANIINNTVTNNRTAINLTNDVSGTHITGNTITDNWTLGIVYYSQGYATNFDTVSVSGNTFDNWYTEVEVKDAGNSTGVLDVSGNTFADNPVTYTTSTNTSLNEPGFAAQKPAALGGTATKPVTALPSLRIYNSPGVTLAYSHPKTLNVNPSQYTTIQSAINDAAAGDTIFVDNGTYNESLNITKNNISIVGQSQAGVILNETSATPFGQGISLDGVSGDSISNMTVNTPQGAPVSYALQAYQAPGLTLSNLSFNGPGKTGTNSHGSKIGGVDVSSSQNVTYNNVSVSNYSKNGFSVTVKYTNSDTASSGLSFNGITANNNNWAGLAFYTVGNDRSPVSTGGSGNITGVSFSGKNTFTNNSQGVFVEGDSDANFISSAAPRFSVTGPSGSTLAITDSVFGGNTQAIVNYQTGGLNASPNYWSNASGPASGQVVGGFGAVTTAPYYTGSDMTVRSDAKVAPDTSGNATVDNSTPQVVVTDSTQPVTVTVTSGTSGAGVDFSSLVTSNTGTIPQTTINSTSASVSIPAATTVTATGGTWDGVITAPTVQSNTSVTVPTPSGTTTTVGTVIEVGAGNISLTFDNAVRLLIPGQAGKLVGFARNGTFTQITDVCSADSQTAGDALAAGGNCYINVGSDMVVWTKHFTTFATYTQAPTPASNPTSSSTTSAAKSNSGNGSDSNTPEVLGVSTPTAKTLSTSTAKPAVAAAAKPSSGKILGTQWYLWLIALAVLGAAGYSVYRYAEGTDSK